MESLILKLFEVSTNLKVYHWKTRLYPEHISTDTMFETTLKYMDKFAEVYLGKVSERFALEGNVVEIINLKNGIDVREYINHFILYINKVKLTPELTNIRDEFVAECEKFLYLMTLTK